MWRKGNLCALLVEMQIGETIMENNMETPQKLKIDLSHNAAIPLLGIYPKKTKY